MSTRDDLGTIWKGTTWTATVTWTDDAGDPVSIVGISAVARFGAEGRPAVLTITDAAGISLADGELVLTLTPTQTAQLGLGGLVAVDVDVSDGAGVVTPLARGIADVGARVGDAA